MINQERKLKGLTPKEIVAELDKFIVGHDEAKKAVAIALRNRIRRNNTDKEIQAEITPKNILMIGPTGVGKTEIARRLAKLSKAPFIKIEATKFTEIGYVGRDVESIIRDLVNISVTDQKSYAYEEVKEEAQKNAIERVLDSLVGKTASDETRDNFKHKLINGKLDSTTITIDILDQSNMQGGNAPSFEIPGMPGAAMGVINISDIFGKVLGDRNTKMKAKTMSVKEALEATEKEEAEKLIEQDQIIRNALNAVERDGIVFLDEIDKIASKNERNEGVSREGVQRDLLPLIEGTTVHTKYGMIKTDHILFICSGAFHLSKPSDLLPELQGRLPIRVELKPLKEKDLARILIEPKNSLIKQYKALMETEGVHLEFNKEAIEKIAAYAAECNSEVEDIGARRLHTIIEKLLEDISFNHEDYQGKNTIIDEKFVTEKLSNIVKNIDLTKFIL